MLYSQVYSIFLAGSFQFRSTLPSIHFVYCLPSYPRLFIFNRVSVLFIWFWMYAVYYFRYMKVNLFCAFLSFWTEILFGFLLLHRGVVFTSARFFLITNVSRGTLKFTSTFSCDAFWCRFSVGIDEVHIFVIRSKCLYHLLKCNEFVS